MEVRTVFNLPPVGGSERTLVRVVSAKEGLGGAEGDVEIVRDGGMGIVGGVDK